MEIPCLIGVEKNLSSQKDGVGVLEKWFHHFSNTPFPRFIEMILYIAHKLTQESLRLGTLRPRERIDDEYADQ